MVVRMRNGPPHRCAPTSATQPASALIASAYLSRTKRPAGTPRPDRGIDRAGREGRGEPGLVQGERRLGRLGQALARSRACGSSWAERSGASSSTGKPLRSRSLCRSAYIRTGRKCCWQSAPWAAKAKRPGVRYSQPDRPGPTTPQLLNIEGEAGWRKRCGALAGCSPSTLYVHKQRGLRGHAPERRHEGLSTAIATWSSRTLKKGSAFGSRRWVDCFAGDVSRAVLVSRDRG
jgi:hypothetical protein